MTRNQKLWVAAAILAAWICGFCSHAAMQLRASGVFYARCEGFNCQVRASMPRWSRDVVLFEGPKFSLSLGNDERGQPIVQQSAEIVAYSLSHLTAYGSHWKPK